MKKDETAYLAPDDTIFNATSRDCLLHPLMPIFLSIILDCVSSIFFSRLT